MERTMNIQFQRKFIVQNMGTNVPIKVLDLHTNDWIRNGTGRDCIQFIITLKRQDSS